MFSLDRVFDFFTKIPSIKFGITDLMDIFFVFLVLYIGIRIIRETRAFQMMKGLLLLALGYFIAYGFEMQASTYIFRFIFSNIIFLFIVIFQPEIRQVVEHIGTNRMNLLKSLFKASDEGVNEVITSSTIEICKAVQKMSDEKIGALIVMEKNTHIVDVIRTGTEIDAKVSEELMGNIFYPKSPLHDGAAVIKDGRVVAAGCVLPLTKHNDEVSSELGTRHRAALGISESSDSMAVVVSEETGAISVAQGGNLTRGISEAELREKILDYLIVSSESKGQNEKNSLVKFVKGLKK